MKTLKVSWTVKNVKDSARMNAMYCFKNCEKNQN